MEYPSIAIHYLKTYWQILRSYIARLFSKPIPRVVGDLELLIRGIVHPMFYSNSKNNLKREAFLPPLLSTDVSLLRLQFTDATFCKKHSKTLRLPNNSYCGLAAVVAAQVEKINIDKACEPVEAAIIGSPMDKQREYYHRLRLAYTWDAGLPMHADLRYNVMQEKGVPNTRLRKFAEEILKVSVYYSDPNPSELNWNGQNIQ